MKRSLYKKPAAAVMFFLAALLLGCQKKDSVLEAGLPDGIYSAEFHTDSTMFHVSEACDGKGVLTVEDGEMIIHISLNSKNIVNLYSGLAKDAKKDSAGLLMPTEDTVTYSDGMTEEVYGFDVPVPALDTEFDLALLGTKGKWYDHKVSVSNAVLSKEGTQAVKASALSDGTYSVDMTFQGGSGKAAILSPVTIVVTDGKATATVQWNSPNYDYMLVDEVKYLPVNTEGDSVFEIPVLCFDEPMQVIGNTVAMSSPHEVEYTLTFHADTIKEILHESSMELQYAENFTVEHYPGGYVLLTTTVDNKKFLLVPEDCEIPQDLEDGIVVLKRPIRDLYLVASSAMDMFCALDGLDKISFSGQKEDGWYIEEAKDAMARGEILYAGKYNKPDYELIVSNGCTLAIENTMISHAPEVVEKLEDFGIPMMIEYSSYEPHPLGRVEWIKFYGALLDKEKEAARIFEEQKAIFERIADDEKTDKTAAFFFVTSNNLIQVRQSTDYIPKIIELAGGKYVFENLGDEESASSSVTLQMEEFYAAARETDYLIYNSTVDRELTKLEELTAKSSLLKDFKAVREGNVYCTSKNLYQSSMALGTIILDIHEMLAGRDKELTYLYRLK